MAVGEFTFCIVCGMDDDMKFDISINFAPGKMASFKERGKYRKFQNI